MRGIILVNISKFLDFDYNFNRILSVYINPFEISKIEKDKTLDRYKLFLTDGSFYVCNSNVSITTLVEYINSQIFPY